MVLIITHIVVYEPFSEVFSLQTVTQMLVLSHERLLHVM